MSTATAPDYAVPEVSGRNYFLYRRLHSLTGLLFGGYLVVHLLVNATLVQSGGHTTGPDAYQVQVDKIHSLPFLAVVEWTFIYLPILYHTIYGIYITVTGQPNVGHYGYGKNWLYVLQRISAMILVFFILFHILAMKGVFGGDVGHALTFDPLKATESATRHMHAGWWVWGIVYPIGILASCYHLANGFWTAGITWGLTVSTKAIHRWGVICTGLFFLTFISGMTALVSLVRMSV